jgi:16S rRNA (adenine1518-N6/adenine1519-N6)-dimethyltransferase
MKLKKSLGQNFLTDSFFLEKIVQSSQIQESDNVIEIGPGDGALTQYILKKSNTLKAIEIDHRFSEKLKKQYENESFEISNADFLKMSLNQVNFENKIIMGNLPYNVSSQIIFKILESELNFKHCIFLIQKELANRFITNQKSSKISIQCQLFCDIEPLFDIPPDAFEPKPKVNSTLIKITPHNNYMHHRLKYDLFQDLLSACFTHPRKKVSKALKNIGLEDKAFSFDINKRPEELEINNFFEILTLYENKL